MVFEPKRARIAASGSLFSMNGHPRKQKCCAIDSAIFEGYWGNSVAAEVPEESTADNRQAVDSRCGSPPSGLSRPRVLLACNPAKLVPLCRLVNGKPGESMSGW